MKNYLPFAWSALSAVTSINTLVSLGQCVNQCGWSWYASLLLSTATCIISIQMWNHTANVASKRNQ